MVDVNSRNFNADRLLSDQIESSDLIESDVIPPYKKYDTSFRGSKGDRRAFKLSTVQGYESNGASGSSFYLWINPSECSWRIPTRTTIEQIQGGAVHHEWDSIGVGLQKPQKFDQAVINFTFQSGNLIPMGNIDVTQVDSALAVKSISKNTFTDGQQGGSFFDDDNLDAPVLPAGLGNLYSFLDLLNQPNITPDGRPNYVVIEYLSMVFPLLTLRGFFTQEGVQWNDSADNPLGITSWGSSFVVFESNPPLFEGGKLAEAYNTFFNQIKNEKLFF